MSWMSIRDQRNDRDCLVQKSRMLRALVSLEHYVKNEMDDRQVAS